jgi:hypothetical protein
MMVHAKRPAKRRQKPALPVENRPAIIVARTPGKGQRLSEPTEEARQEAAAWLRRQLVPPA